MRVLAESYLTLLGDWNHWAFELTVEACTAAVGFVLGARWVRRHDAKHHPEAGRRPEPGRPAYRGMFQWRAGRTGLPWEGEDT